MGATAFADRCAVYFLDGGRQLFRLINGGSSGILFSAVSAVAESHLPVRDTVAPRSLTAEGGTRVCFTNLLYNLCVADSNQKVFVIGQFLKPSNVARCDLGGEGSAGPALTQLEQPVAVHGGLG